MALPGTHTFKTVDLTSYSPSVGASPVAAYIRVPFRCQIMKVTAVLGGAITSADSLVTCAVNGGAAFATIDVVQSGSAAGQLNSATPGASAYANEDDVVSFTPSGAGGANVPAFFSLVVRQQ